MQRKLSALFLCSHNSARSQMAEALLRHHAGSRFNVYSAGLEPSEINPFTRMVLAEIGLDMKEQYAKNLLDYWGGKFNFTYLVTVCDRAEEKCPIFPFATYRLFWPFEDPSSVMGTDHEKVIQFRLVRDEIDQKIQTWIADLEASGVLSKSTPQTI